MKMGKLKQRDKNGTDLEVKVMKINHTESEALPYRVFFMYPPTRKNNYQYSTILSISLCRTPSEILNLSIKNQILLT